MLDQIIGAIKNVTISTVGLVMGIFGASDADLLGSADVDLSEFAQATIFDSINNGDVTNEVVSRETSENQILPEGATDYFVREDLPKAVFSRPASMATSNATFEELITLGEEGNQEVRAINPIKTTSLKNEKVNVTKILNTNFDNFDTKLQITEITEDENNFYVTYQYLTLGIEDNTWQEILKIKNLSVTKDVLEGADLGVYLSEELSEVIDTEIIYLKEAQSIQKIKKAKADKLSLTQKADLRVTAFDYSSLIGKVLDAGQSSFGGYQPVVKEVVVKEVVAIPEIVVAEIPAEIVDNEDNQAPVLVIQGNNPALIQIGSSYSDMGVRVTDNISEGLDAEVGGDIVNTSISGSYFVIYTAIDAAGNIATATREVIVYDYGTAPEVVPVEPVEIIVEPVEILEPEVLPEEIIVEEVVVPVISDKEQNKIDKKAQEPLIDEEVLPATVVEIIDEDLPVTELVEEPIEVIEEIPSDIVVEEVPEVLDTIIEEVSPSTNIIQEITTDIIEATSDLAEEVTAMLKSINIRELLGSVTFAGDSGIGGQIKGAFDTAGRVVYSSINKVLDIVWSPVENLFKGEK